MNLKNIYEDGQMYYKSVWNLYEKAFPKEEQKSVEIMELLKDQGKMEIYAIEDQGEFIGLAMNMIWGDMGLLDYLPLQRIKETVVMAAGVSGFFWKNSKTENIFLKLKSRMNRQRIRLTENGEKYFI